MTDDLCAVWRSAPPASGETIMAAVNAVLEEDRAVRVKERGVRLTSVLAVAVLCPLLVWCTAFGRTPLVRGGFALMAIGAVVMVMTEWMYRTASRQALPGPVDARSQLLKTGLLLSSQVTLLETTALLGAPIFCGAALIGLWVYQERTHAAAYLIWVCIGVAWALSVVAGRSKVRELKARRGRLEDVLEALGENARSG